MPKEGSFHMNAAKKPKQLGFWSIYLLGINGVIGSGAFLLPQTIYQYMDLMSIAAVLVGGVYVIWWGIVAVKSLAAHWNSFYWENKLLAIVRTLVAATLVMFVIVWLMLPLEFDVVQDMTQVMPICGWAGGLAIATAVGLVVEGALWIKYCSY